jgi:hypothetical protein
VFFFFFGREWCLIQGFMPAKQVLYGLMGLRHMPSSFCTSYFKEGGLVNYLRGLASNQDPSDLSFK